MTDMPKSQWKQIPNSYSYLAQSLAVSIGALCRRPTHGSWPLKPWTESKVTIGPGGVGPNGRPYEGDVSLTLANTWPFTVKATDQLVIGYLAASAYDAYVDTFEAHMDAQALLAERCWKLPPIIWKQQGIHRKEEMASGVNWKPKVEVAAHYLRAAWDAARFFSDFPRIASYTNLELGLTVEAADEKKSAINLFMLCAGGDAWVHDEIYNRLYEVIIEGAVKRAWALDLVTTPDEEDQLREQVGKVLDDINLTVHAFAGLDDPWDTEDDIEIAKILNLQLARYMEVLGDAAGEKIMVGGSQQGEDGSEGMQFDEDGMQELPELLEELLSDTNISDALSNLQSQAPDADHDSEQSTGIAAGNQENVIQVDYVRAPTSEEVNVANDLAEVLSGFSFQHRPGEMRHQEEGQVVPLDWFVAKQQSPGTMNWRRQPIRDRRPEFSLALAVVCDTSGSMGMGRDYSNLPIHQLSSGLFCLTEGFRKAVRFGSPSKLWVGCFNSVWELVTVKAGQVSQFKADGGTRPTEAIRAATAWLDDQPVAHRYLVVWTDDEWGGWDESALNSKAPHTRIMFTPPNINGDRGHFKCHGIDSPRQMVNVIQKTIGDSFTALSRNMR